MATHVKNTSRVPKQVKLVLADGKTKTCIRVMPRTRKGITLPAGATIDSNWLALEGKGIISWDDKPPVVASPLTTVQSTPVAPSPPPAPASAAPAPIAEPEAKAATADAAATKTENK